MVRTKCLGSPTTSLSGSRLGPGATWGRILVSSTLTYGRLTMSPFPSSSDNQVATQCHPLSLLGQGEIRMSFSPEVRYLVKISRLGIRHPPLTVSPEIRPPSLIRRFLLDTGEGKGYPLHSIRGKGGFSRLPCFGTDLCGTGSRRSGVDPLPFSNLTVPEPLYFPSFSTLSTNPPKRPNQTVDFEYTKERHLTSGEVKKITISVPE